MDEHHPPPKLKRRAKANKSNQVSFPYWVMSGAAGKFTEVYSRSLEVPQQFLYMAYMTCLGSMLANRLTLASEISPQPRLYVLLLGESASERKSTALIKATDFFKYALEDDYLDCFKTCWGIGSAEGLQSLFKTNDRILLCYDEFRSFVGKTTIKSSVLLPCVNTLFESNRYENALKNSYLRLENAHLSLLAASTVQTYESIYDPTFIDIGFSNRVFIVPGTAKRKFSFPEKIDQAEKASLKVDLINVISHVDDFLALDLTDKAKEVYHKWYMNLRNSLHTRRLDTYALRLMPLVAVNDLKSEVDVETVHKVTSLCDWQLKVRIKHDPIDADNKVARMEQKIRRVLQEEDKTDRSLKQRTNAYRYGLWCYKTATKNLVEAEEIKFDKRISRWVRLR